MARIAFNCCHTNTLYSRRIADIKWQLLETSAFGLARTSTCLMATIHVLPANFSRLFHQLILHLHHPLITLSISNTHFIYCEPVTVFVFLSSAVALQYAVLQIHAQRKSSRITKICFRIIANPSSTGCAARHLHPSFFRIQSPHQLIIQEVIL